MELAAGRRAREDSPAAVFRGVVNLKSLDQTTYFGRFKGFVERRGLVGVGQSLGLDGTKITDAGIAKLQQALPNCNIYRN